MDCGLGVGDVRRKWKLKPGRMVPIDQKVRMFAAERSPVDSADVFFRPVFFGGKGSELNLQSSTN